MNIPSHKISGYQHNIQKTVNTRCVLHKTIFNVRKSLLGLANYIWRHNHIIQYTKISLYKSLDTKISTYLDWDMSMLSSLLRWKDEEAEVGAHCHYPYCTYKKMEEAAIACSTALVYSLLRIHLNSLLLLSLRQSIAAQLIITAF